MRQIFNCFCIENVEQQRIILVVPKKAVRTTNKSERCKDVYLVTGERMPKNNEPHSKQHKQIKANENNFIYSSKFLYPDNHIRM